jgi:hypothetical protein
MQGDMSGPAAWMMVSSWDTRYFLLIFAMWVGVAYGRDLGAGPRLTDVPIRGETTLASITPARPSMAGRGGGCGVGGKGK